MQFVKLTSVLVVAAALFAGVLLFAKKGPEKVDVEQFARDLMERYKEPAILLHRPFPVPRDLNVRSRLGGLPQLPDDVDWPRGDVPAFDMLLKDGKRPTRNLPLHFLAQIDCVELPESQTLLPKSGVLFFFANIDDSMNWGNGDDREQVRVIYAEDVSIDQPTREPPADLRPIHDLTEFSQYSTLPNFRLRRKETDGKLYQMWPIEMGAVMSYPQVGALYGVPGVFDDDEWIEWEEEFYEAYEEISLEKMSNSFLKLTNVQRDLRIQHGWRDRLEAQKGFISDFVEHPDSHKFPHSWRVIHEVSLHIAYAARRPLEEFNREIERIKQHTALLVKVARGNNKWEEVEKQSAILEKLERGDLSENKHLQRLKPTVVDAKNKVHSEALEWVSLAEQSDLDSIPTDHERRKFNSWLAETRDRTGANFKPSNSITKAMTRVVEYWTVSGSKALIVPDEYYYFFGYKHRQTMFYNAKKATHRPYGHQMLGHFPSSQDPKSVTDNAVGLLHLYSDDGLNFLFGDVGEVQFFIEPDDLKNQRFDKAWAIMNGG